MADETNTTPRGAASSSGIERMARDLGEATRQADDESQARDNAMVGLADASDFEELAEALAVDATLDDDEGLDDRANDDDDDGQPGADPDDEGADEAGRALGSDALGGASTQVAAEGLDALPQGGGEAGAEGTRTDPASTTAGVGGDGAGSRVDATTPDDATLFRSDDQAAAVAEPETGAELGAENDPVGGAGAEAGSRRADGAPRHAPQAERAGNPA